MPRYANSSLAGKRAKKSKKKKKFQFSLASIHVVYVGARVSHAVEFGATRVSCRRCPMEKWEKLCTARKLHVIYLYTTSSESLSFQIFPRKSKLSRRRRPDGVCITYCSLVIANEIY